MSHARYMLPGGHHATTRRCAEGRPLLKPCQLVNQIILYAIGYQQQRLPGIQLYAASYNVNHKHDGLQDDQEESRIPEFYQNLHAMIAKAVNAHYGRGGAVWEPGTYDNVELPPDDPGTCTEQLLYIWTQLVKDGIVDRPEDWPGVQFLPEDLGSEIVVDKPETAYFGCRPENHEPTDPNARKRWRKKQRKDKLGRSIGDVQRAPKPPRERSKLPEQVTIKIGVPPGFEGWPIEDVRAHFRELLDRRIEEILEARKHRRRRAVGVARIMKLDPNKSLGDTFPTFARNPRVAGRRNLASFLRRLGELVEWRRRYREAWQAWKRGRRDVRFPYGTYLMPRRHGALVATPP